MWRYVQTRLLSLGNEHCVIQGTHMGEASLEAMTNLAVTDYKARDSSIAIHNTALTTYIESL